MGPSGGRPARLARVLTVTPSIHIGNRTVVVAGTQNLRCRHSRFIRCFAITDSLQPHFHRWTSRNPLQLTPQELLHGLPLKRGSDRKLVTDFFGYAPYSNLYSHASIVTSICNYTRPLYAFWSPATLLDGEVSCMMSWSC